MSIVTATFDTVSKEMSLTMDGVAVDNATYVCMGKRYDSDEHFLSVTTEVEDEENKIRRYSNVTAADLGGQGDDIPGLPGFKVSPVDSLKDRLNKYLRQK